METRRMRNLVHLQGITPLAVLIQTGRSLQRRQ
jgi:hypothetical protein